jgi:glycosidase
MLKEEEQVRSHGPGPSEAMVFTGSGADDYERFSKDLFWMPNLVLLSKNILVWLDQLSKKYGRTITTLDQIPDEELDLLRERGITGLWLIGLWERSPASKRIKHKTGNISAESSAYAIYDYRVADNLGGNQALKVLREKLMNRGIRIGADMVPNHTGITSQWVIEHPEWFIHTEEVPFSSYSFTGEDLSSNDKVSIYLEDSYYDRSDAAVVFKHVDNENGKIRYIYHGNDGTSMPWNDTAQLDFLNPEVRDAVTEKIVDIAHLFDIIRFDAAMVLTKQHIRRLWYPKSGEGGAIPSRSRVQLSDEEFDSRMPVEFWREVVDRVNQQAPETLLLAEAFWLLEGYFVRTLGMHRVYNSAFMNMLRDEENSKYRQTVKNILEYNPEILKRFVNYLTTPDEEPAIKNFGDDDKYFGVATMMVTMPGLPLFGHGQFEGFEEKYGMEYSNAFHEEEVRNDLVERHHREIVPLLHKRYLFAESENFYFYDFYTDEGKVNEDVFVYSNLYQNERSLVIYNNRYSEAAGWIKTSVAFSDNDHLRQIELYDGLKLSDEEGYLLFKDHVTGLQYLRSKDEIRHKGLFATVGAFKYHVFTDFEQIHENLETWAMVASKLAGRGTADIHSLFNELKTQPAVEVEEESVVESEVMKQQEDIPEEVEETVVETSETSETEALIVTESEELRNELREYEEQVKNLIKERDALEEKVDELKYKLSELEDDENEVQVEIDQITRDYTVLEDENTKLKVQNDELNQRIELLEKEVRELKERERLTTDLNEESLDEEEGPISTNLVENIIRRLTNYPKGLRLRNLAMSMGINMHTALWVDIVYKDSEDSNPLIVMKKTS